jgi:hypothetical protein
MRSNKRQQKHTYTYGTRFIRGLQRFFAYAVILVQLALPVAPVFASEDVIDTPIPEAVSAESPSPEIVDEVITVNESQEENLLSPADDVEILPEVLQTDISLDTPPSPDTLQESAAVIEDVESSVESIPNVEVVLEEDASLLGNSTEEDLVEEDPLQADATSSPVTADETASLSEIASTSLEAGEVETPDTIPVVVEEVDTILIPQGVATETPTSTEEVTVLQPESHVVVNDNNRFSFSERECARVGDGSFYCSTGVATVTETGVNRVFSAPDADGDQEIYIEHDGVLTSVTSNPTDDSAPYYDVESNSLVWHRLVGERYQIVSYDIESATEAVLTADRYNNMQPSRAGEITVWQGWIGNDWEIMLDTSGEITMLTDNTTNDVAPRINGDYIIWQAYEGDAWKAKIYNIRTKEIETIADTEGTSVENPRFVLVYDAKSENGDVETKGYDPVSGVNVPLSSEPTPAPSDIPDSDQTGEKRALITTNTQLKTKTEDDTDPDVLPNEPISIDSGGATSTSDIVIPPLPELSVPEMLSTESSSTSEILDIVIPLPIEIAPSIPDLVIEPFVSAISEEVLPQQTVATSS